MKHVTVDLSQITGKIKPMHGVNNAPFGSPQTGLNTKQGFADAGFPVIRNNDAAQCLFYVGEHSNDILNIFTDFDADETDPANYDFFYTDKYLRDTYACGGKLLYRLGSKIEAFEKKYQTIPPKDYHKYARICERVMSHYLEGWADGFRYDVPYWEIWNEADNYKANGSNHYWQGTIEQFHEFYEVMAKHLKARFPNQKIGGPAYTAGIRKGDYIEAFLAYGQAHDVPLDFFSFHNYGTDPYSYVDDVNFVRGLLDKYGYADTEIVIDEWNYIRGKKPEEMCYSYDTMPNEKGAAFCAAAMLAVQKTELAAFCYYDARPDCSYNGLFTPYTFRRTKTYYSFWQFNKLYKLEREVYSDTDCRELFVGAAAGDNEACVQLAYYADAGLEPELVEVSLKGLQGDTEVTCMLIDSQYTNEPVRSEIFTTEQGKIYLRLKDYSTVFLTIKPACLCE